MSLDVGELVMAVEDEFGIKIKDADYEYIATVADMQRIVMWKMPNQQSTELVQARQSECQSVRVFLELRAALRAAVPMAPPRIRPSDSLEALLPFLNRQRYWAAWSRKAPVPLPYLKTPSVADALLSLASILFGLAAFATLIVLILLLEQRNFGATLTAGGAFGVLLAVTACLSYVQLAWLPRLMPEGVATMGDLVREILPWTMPYEPESFRGARVLERLRQIIHEQLSIPLDQIHPHSRFVDDLGC